jgi:hypothetical protein
MKPFVDYLASKSPNLDETMKQMISDLQKLDVSFGDIRALVDSASITPVQALLLFGEEGQVLLDVSQRLCFLLTLEDSSCFFHHYLLRYSEVTALSISPISMSLTLRNNTTDELKNAFRIGYQDMSTYLRLANSTATSKQKQQLEALFNNQNSKACSAVEQQYVAWLAGNASLPSISNTQWCR